MKGRTMEKGDIFRLNITDTNENGMGIAKHDGMVIFIPNLVEGDTADVRIVSLEKSYAIGEPLSLADFSEYRVESCCSSADDCGGCTLSHVSYEYENIIKKNTVRAAFRRCGLPYDIVEDTVFSSRRTGYRNKIGVHYSSENGYFGLYKAQSNDVIPFDGCAICPDIMSDIIRFTNAKPELLAGCGIDEIFIRTSGEKSVTVSLYSEKKSDIGTYSEALRREFCEIDDVVLINSNKKLSEKTYIHDRICGVDMRFSSEAFRQVNKDAFEKLLGLVHSFAAEADFRYAADLYCGSGIIGLTLAKRLPDARFWGIEINAEAISDAKYNAEANNIGNIEFFCGDAASFGRKIPREIKPELIVVDPPRAGLSKAMIVDLKMLSPDRLIYVSCNPQTLARDLKEICGFRYSIGRVCPVNMFPMTRHCECVVYLSRD